MGGGLCEGVSGGGSPPADFSIPAGEFSGGFFWRIFPLHFATKKSTAKSTAPWRVLVSERNSPASPPPRESKSKSCAFGSGTVTFQGGSFQEKTPGLIGPRNLRILIGRIAVGWLCMECHVPCHISIYWVWDSVKQSEGWGRNTALNHSKVSNKTFNFLIEKFHHKSSLLVWLPNGKHVPTNPISAFLFQPQTVTATPADPRGEKIFVFLANSGGGGEKTFRKVPVNYY